MRFASGTRLSRRKNSCACDQAARIIRWCGQRLQSFPNSCWNGLHTQFNYRQGYQMAKNKVSAAITRLVFQFTALAGGAVKGVSPYEIARPKMCEILRLSPSADNPGMLFKRNYTVLKKWMDENHPGGTKKPQKAAKRGRSTHRPATQASVLSFVNQSKIDVSHDDFLKSFEWRSIRMMALKQHSAKCQCCGATPATGAVINVDHIKPRKLFPELALSIDNLQVLCHDCNHGKGNWDQTDWRAVNTQHLSSPSR